MVADTVVIAVISNGVAGSGGEYMVLYNPTPFNIPLTGDTVNEGAVQEVPSFPAGLNIKPFHFFTIGDDLGVPVDHVDNVGWGNPVGVVNYGTTWTIHDTSPYVTGGFMIVRKPSARRFIARFLDSGVNGNIGDPNNGIMVDSSCFTTFAADQGDSYIFTRNDTGRLTGGFFYTETAQPIFICSAPLTAMAGSNFGLSCTMTMKIGDTVHHLADSTVTDYSGPAAWADLIVDQGQLNGLSADSRFVSGVLNNFQVNIGNTSGNVILTARDAFCTGSVTITIIAAGDTLALDTPVSGIDTTGAPNRYETTSVWVLVAGRSSGDSMFINGDVSNDTVRIRVNNVAGTTVFHSSGQGNVTTDTGHWRVWVALRENTGETIQATLFRYGQGKLSDTEWRDVSETVQIVLDNTRPRMTKIADTSVRNGYTSGLFDTRVLFYIVDTGAGFDATGGCTLIWHTDTAYDATNTSTSPMTVKDDGSGTWVIEATIPIASLNPTYDTTLGFWVWCRDDVGNVLNASSLSPAYLEDAPGTITIDVASVRDVVISEIMADGSTGEYVELYNATNVPVSLNGWSLSDAGTAGNSFFITFNATHNIAPFGYFLVYSEGDEYNVFADFSSHDSASTSTWDANDLQGFTSGETLSIRASSGLEIDSTGYVGDSVCAEWAGNPTDTTFAFSYERILTWSGGRLVAGYGATVAQWDTHTGQHGNGGRRNGSPGHINSINVPNIDTITPTTVVQAAGRGLWDITVTNGRNALTSNGRIVVQAPPGWSPPQATATVAGYTTVYSEDNGAAGSALSFSGRSAILTFTSFPARARVTLRYGNNTSSRSAIAQADSSPGRTFFQLFYDTDGSAYEQIGDSLAINFGSNADTLVLVTLTQGSATDTYRIDTSPTGNPRSFFNAEYDLTWTISDSSDRPIYGAHITADTDGRLGGGAGYGDTQFPHLSEYSSFTGFYHPTGLSIPNLSGWTNSRGQFTFTVTMSETVGANMIRITDTDMMPGADAHQYTDSARSPIPVITEVGWDGTGSGEFIEIYNPTHEVQNVYNWHIRKYDQAGYGVAQIDVDSSNFRSLGSIAPFSYAVFVDAINTVQDSGLDNAGTDSAWALANEIDLDDNTRDSIMIRSDTDIVDIVVKTTGRGWWNDNPTGNSDGTPDKGAGASLERIWPNRSGNLEGSWATAGSDSSMFQPANTVSGYATPGRPNASSLSAYTGNFLDPWDTFAKSGDTARIDFTLRIATGDTQPRQQFGFTGAWGITSNIALNTGVTISNTTSGATTDYGTSFIRVYQDSGQNGPDSFATAVSGTFVVRIVQPFGVPDTVFFVFDRGESLGYKFEKSETNISYKSADSDLIFWVRFSDTYSGLSRKTATIYDTPLFRWRFYKISRLGAYPTTDPLNAAWSRFEHCTQLATGGDSYWCRIDLSRYGANYRDSGSNDTVLWQVTWRDQAGNYDTSPDTIGTGNRLQGSPRFDTAFEFVEANDTVDIFGPRSGDTVGGPRTVVQFRVRFSNAATCSVVIEYDTDASGADFDSITFGDSDWPPQAPTTVPDSTPVLVCDFPGTTYVIRWNVMKDLPDTRFPNARLRARVFDFQSGRSLGDTILSPLGISTILADPPDTPTIEALMGDTVRLVWTNDTFAKYFIVWRDSGNPTHETSAFINVTRMVTGRDSIADIFGLTLDDTHVGKPPGERVPRVDSYYVWYIMAIDTYDNFHQLRYGFGDSLDAPYVYVNKIAESITTRDQSPWETKPGATITYLVTVSNTEGYSPAYRLRLTDYFSLLVDYKDTSVDIDTSYGYIGQTDNADTDYVRRVVNLDSDYLQIDLKNPFNPGDTARIKFKVIIR